MNRPEENSKAASNYMPDVEDVRELIQLIALLPQDGRQKTHGFVLAHLGMAVKGYNVQPIQKCIIENMRG